MPGIFQVRKIAALLTLFCLVSVMGQSAEVSGNGEEVLIIAQDHAWPPFAFLNEQGEPQGLLVELWQVLGKQMGREVRFYLTDWEDSIRAVREGRAHVHGGLIASPERSEFFDFSAEILPVQAFLFVASANMPLTLSEIHGRGVGVIAGSYEMEFMQHQHPETPLVSFASNDQMIQAAVSGRLTAFVADYPVGLYLLDRYAPPGAFHPLKMLYSRHLSAGFPRGNEALQEAIDISLATLGEEEVRRLSQRWTRSEKVEVLPFWLWPVLGGGFFLLVSLGLAAYSLALRRQRCWLLADAERKNAALRESEARFRGLSDNTFAGIYILLGRRFITVNPAMSRILGYSEEELLSMDLAHFVHPDHREMVLERAKARQEGSRVPSRYEMKVVTREGQTRWVEISAVSLFHEGRNAAIGTFFDITERKEIEHIREEALALLHKVSANIPGVIYQFCLNSDGSSCFPYISRRVSEILPVTPEELTRDAASLMGCVHPEDMRPVYRSMRVSAVRLDPWRCQFRLRYRTGGYRWCEGQASPEKEGDGRTVWYGYLVDIQDWKDAQERMTHMALHDPLTELPNRTLFEDRARQLITAGERERVSFALVFIDLDYFKPINDTLGHGIGDLVLKEVAARIRATIRVSDTAARIGGDEFVVLLHAVHGSKDAGRVAEKIRLALRESLCIENHTLQISASIGIALYPVHGKDLITLTAHADRAMYHSKEKGRDTVSFYAGTVETA